MYVLPFLGAGALLAAAVTGSPLPETTTKKGFTVTGSVPKPLPVYPLQLANIYKKYGKDVPEHVAAAVAAATSTGSVPAIPYESDIAYLSPITIGGQKLNVDFDTGSADLWVFSSELTAKLRQGHDIYDPSKSKTSKVIPGATWRISYGDGSSASGTVYTDNVSIGGITVKKQSVEIADTISSQFARDTTNDGLMGLAFSSINTVQPQAQTGWFDSGIEQGVFERNLFAVDLKHAAPGTYDFGFIDENKYTGDITYVDVDSSKGFWEFTVTGAGAADNLTSGIGGQSIDAIADTGTTLLLMDDDIVTSYYSQISGADIDGRQGGYVFPCSADVPDFVLEIGGVQSKIPGSLMSLGGVGSGNCFGGLQSNQGIEVNILGDVWLKSVFAVFDVENKQFGWAEKEL